MLLVSVIIVCLVGSQALANPDLNNNRQCEPIRIELCRGIGYNETSMPNLVGHEVQTDADFTLQTFNPLIQYGCSSQLHFFLCAAYVPMCTPKVPVPIGPCRGLCETIRARCLPVLQGFGFPWPSALDCNRFPEENNHEHMCMEGPGEPNGGLPPPTSKIYNHYSGNCQDLVKSHLYARLNRSGRCAPLCEADILFDQQEKHLAEVWVTAWSVTALFTAIVATLCLILTDTKWDKILMPLVICHLLVAVGWSVRWLAKRNPTACGYDPQLPGVSLLLIDGLSNAPCAATFLLRYFFGMAAGVWWAILCLKWQLAVRRMRCESVNQHSHNGLITGGVNSAANSAAAQPMLLMPGSTVGHHHGAQAALMANNHANLATIITTGNANGNNNGATLNKATAGPSASASKSSNSTYSTLARLTAWGVPALQTVAVLVARFVDADELLGSCFVGNQSDKALRLLVAMPLFCYWIIGSVNLFIGYLLRPQQFCGSSPQVKKGGNHQRTLPEPMDGMGTFLFTYCVPSALLMISVFYEFANRDLWLNLPQPSMEPASAVKAPMWPFMMRAFMELLLGVIASAWALGPRAITFWRSKTNTMTKSPQNQIKNTFNHPGNMQFQMQQQMIHPQPISLASSNHFIAPSNKFNPSNYPAVSYQTVCQAPSSYLSATGSMPRHIRKYQHHPQAVSSRKLRPNYKMTLSQSISLTGNETIL